MQALKTIIDEDYDEYVRGKQAAINASEVEGEKGSDFEDKVDVKSKFKKLAQRNSNEFEMEIDDERTERDDGLKDDPYFSQSPGGAQEPTESEPTEIVAEDDE